MPHATGRAVAAVIIAVVPALACTCTASTSPTFAAAAKPAAAAPACGTAGLEVWLGLGPGAAAAGSAYYPLEFTNVTERICHLYGFPRISAVTVSGGQLGSPAARDHSSAPHTVTLAPGATAHVALQLADAGNFEPAACHPVVTAGLRIYPPGQASAALVGSFSFPACSATGPDYLSVGPVQPGVGVPGRQ